MKFHLGDILSITTGRLMPPNGIGGVYRILNHLTGDDLMTHQLPAATEAMAPYLIAQLPELAAVDPPEQFDGVAHVESWLAEQVAEHGEWHEITAPSSALWGEHDPIQELRDMAPHLDIVVVELPPDERGIR